MLPPMIIVFSCGRKWTKRRLLDRLFLFGWMALVVIGQCFFPRESTLLQAVAVGWLWTAAWLVSRTYCLPLLLLSTAAFMVDSERPWAWAQPVMVAMLLARVLLTDRRPRHWFGIAAAGCMVVLLSWPREASALLADVLRQPVRDIARQWMRPAAVWAIFPFRQMADRALVTMLLTGVLLDRRYLSTPRLLAVIPWMAWLPLLAAFGADLLPWQAPHRFLGTTNFPGYGFSYGPGINVSYLTLPLAVGLPYVVLGVGGRHRWVRRSTLFLFLPLVRIQQRAFGLALFLLAITGLFGTLVRYTQRRKQHAARRNIRRLTPRTCRKAAAIALASLTLSVSWFYKQGIGEPYSAIRQILRHYVQCLNVRAIRSRSVSSVSSERPPAIPSPDTPARSSAPEGTSTHTVSFPQTPASDGAVSEACGHPVLFPLRQWLTRWDPVRGHMWHLVLRVAIRTYWLHGAGAGTWARFHRAQPRPYRLYYAHTHNTYVDMIYEYGLLPCFVFFSLAGLALLRFVKARPGVMGLWVFYAVAVAAMGLGQHLLYAFTNLCLLTPLALVLARSMLLPWNRDATGSVSE